MPLFLYLGVYSRKPTWYIECTLSFQTETNKLKKGLAEMAQDRKSIYDFFPRFEQIQLKEFYGSTKIFGFSPEVGEYIAFTVYANGEIFYKSQLDGGEGPGELINPAKCYHKEGYFSEIDGNRNFVKYSCKHCPETWEI